MKYLGIIACLLLVAAFLWLADMAARTQDEIDRQGIDNDES